MPPMNTLEQQLAAANSRPASKPEAAAEKPARRPARRAAAAAATTAPASRADKVHIGAWLHKDFQKSLLLLRAETGEKPEALFARILNAEFRARKVPIVNK